MAIAIENLHRDKGLADHESRQARLTEQCAKRAAKTAQKEQLEQLELVTKYSGLVNMAMTDLKVGSLPLT